MSAVSAVPAARGGPWKKGVDYYDRRNIHRQVRTHIQRLESLGFNVTLTPIPDLTGCPALA
jgi:hypothetical protein